MTPNELAENNRWIAERVFGYRPTDDPDKWTETDGTLLREESGRVLIGLAYEIRHCKNMFAHTWHSFDCTHPFYAYELEQKIVDKCKTLMVGKSEEYYWAETVVNRNGAFGFGVTRAEAVILLARKIWK